MDDKLEVKTEQMESDEAALLRASAQAHKNSLKDFWRTFATTGVIAVAIVAVIVLVGLGWFVSNSRVTGTGGTISFNGQSDFALATIGNKSQGTYDSLFGLSDGLTTETIGGTEYYIASGNSSFRVDSDKNFNNYLANADLRPGNRGTFDLYVICRSEQREMILRPLFTAWYETGNNENPYQDAFLSKEHDRNAAAEFLKGHILLFANMDDKGMYSENLDVTKDINIDLNTRTAYQIANTTFRWGESVYKDSDTEVYRLPVYWVWPEQFGNFIYTGNSYNKNLFADKDNRDYKYFVSEMEDGMGYKKFFLMNDGEERPKLDTITSPADYQQATKNYELYSGWYNAADEIIGNYISYIELGFEIAE